MSTRFRYFPQDIDRRQWGLHLTTVGWLQSSPNEEYPPRQHPTSYYYTWATGRKLAEYQISLVFSGHGVAEFARGKPTDVESGSLILIAPGRWHRCRPDENTGWGTLWFGFNGKMAQPIVRSIFRTDECAVLPLAQSTEFKYAAIRLIARALKDAVNKPFTVVGELATLLGRLADGDFNADDKVANADAIRNAQFEIARRHVEVIDFHELAESIGVPYNTFRQNFAAETGMSPLQFQLSERLRTAKNLVANTDMPIQEIARRTGFSSAAYFTRFFRNATKMSPCEYRRAQSMSS